MMIRIEHNVQTGKIKEIELSQKEIDFAIKETNSLGAESLIRKAEAEAKATAKADLLAKLGITAEEASLLLS